MSIRTLAETDLGIITEDAITGFGWSITLINPSGVSKIITGLTTDISEVIDPDTGILVSGRTASVAIRLSSIYSAFPSQELPRSIADEDSNPWLISFNDINGNSYNFKISESNPDRAIGLLICHLELYEV